MLCSPQGQVPKNLSRVKYKTENAMPGIKKKKIMMDIWRCNDIGLPRLAALGRQGIPQTRQDFRENFLALLMGTDLVDCPAGGRKT